MFSRPDLFNIDIGLICLNAGTYASGPMDLVDDAEFEAQYGLNVLHVVYMTKALLERQLARKHRSAIMITSSGISYMPGLPGIQSYVCTKKCVSNFGVTLHNELKEMGIDVLVWNAGSIDTNMSRAAGQGQPRGAKPEVAVRSILKDLGRSVVSDGLISH